MDGWIYLWVNTYIHTYIQPYIHTTIHTYNHTYIHTYIHTIIRSTYIHNIADFLNAQRRKRPGKKKDEEAKEKTRGAFQ